MNRISAAIIDVEHAIAELRAGRGPSRQGTVNLLRRVLDALWEQQTTSATQVTNGTGREPRSRLGLPGEFGATALGRN